MDVIEDIITRRKQVNHQGFESKVPEILTNESNTTTMDSSVNSMVVNTISAGGGSITGGGIFAGKKILVVDDAVSILKLMSHTLKNKADAIVTQAKDGQQAVDACEKQDFDLILTDIQMPVLDGFGEAKCIRATEKERRLPRKRSSSDRMAIDAEEADMDAFMDKPFKLEELTSVYIKLLEKGNRPHRDNSSCKTTLAPGVDSSLGAIVRAHRSIRNVTPNAKIFVDVSELDDVTVPQTVGETLTLEQDGTSPTSVGAISNISRKATVVTEEISTNRHELPPISGKGTGYRTMSDNAKVHVAN